MNEAMRGIYRTAGFLSLICIFQFSMLVNGQGCSDAGFCTMGAMKPDQHFNKKVPIKLRAIELNLYQGESTISPTIRVATLDFSLGIGELNSIQVKLPYQAVSGNFGNTSGLGDISLSATRKIHDSDNFDVSVTVGTKIPSNDSNLENTDSLGNTRDYPMYYQTSLGTFDLIAGASIISRDWLFATGVQIALNENRNEYRSSEWIDSVDFVPYSGGPEYVLQNDSAFHLKRGTDIMLRVERNFRLARFNMNVGLLPIWRISKDRLTNEATGETFQADGTTGLALSGLLGFGYQFNVNSGLKLILGWKIRQREFNPDGLTRNSVTSLSYYYRF